VDIRLKKRNPMVSEKTKTIDRLSYLDHEDWHHDIVNEGESQYKRIHENLAKKIEEYGSEKKMDKSQLGKIQLEAGFIFLKIADALKHHWKNAPKDQFWDYPNITSDLNSPEKWHEVSPVNATLLDIATAKYLKSPWMQINTIDLFILRGFIFNELAHYSDGIKSGSLEGRFDLAHLITGGKLEKMLLVKALLGTIKIFLQWILLPMVAAISYYYGYEKTTLSVLLAYTVIVVITILLAPKRYFRNRERRETRNKLAKNVEKLMNVYRMLSYRTLNPSQLRSQLKDLEQYDLYLSPPVYSILDRAIQRDPYVLLEE